MSFIDALLWLPLNIWSVITAPLGLLVILCVGAIVVGILLEPERHSPKWLVWTWLILPWVFVYLAVALLIYVLNNSIGPFSWVAY